MDLKLKKKQINGMQHQNKLKSSANKNNPYL